MPTEIKIENGKQTIAITTLTERSVMKDEIRAS
jgi:hypothetical protein